MSEDETAPYYGAASSLRKFRIDDYPGADDEDESASQPIGSYLGQFPIDLHPRGYDAFNGLNPFHESSYPEPPEPPQPPSYDLSGRKNAPNNQINRSSFLSNIFDSNTGDVDTEYTTAASEIEESQDDMSETTSRRAGRRGRPRGSKNSAPRRPRKPVVPLSTLPGILDDPTASVRGRRRGPMKPAEPSTEFSQLQSQATVAYMRREFATAADYARRAVRINPEVFAAHSLLSECLLELGEDANSVAALLSGAHVKRDPQVWHDVADRTWKLEGIPREQLVDQVWYCCQNIMKIQPNDYRCRQQRLEIFVERDQKSRGLKECKAMLVIQPRDLEVLQTMAELSIALDDCEDVLLEYESVINSCISDEETSEMELTWSIVNVYLDILYNLRRYAYGITRLRSLARWFFGREEETFWDSLEDDREWDIDDSPRRTEVPEFTPGNHPRETYGEGLPLEFRVKLGTFRLQMGEHHADEAFHHIRHLASDGESKVDVSMFDDLFKEIGDTLRTKGYCREALWFLEPLELVPGRYNSDLLQSLATCYSTVGRYPDAVRCQEEVVKLRQGDDDHRMKLIQYYERSNMEAEALALAQRMVAEGKSQRLESANIKLQKAIKEIERKKRDDETQRKRDEAESRRREKQKEKEERLQERLREREEKQREKEEKKKKKWETRLDSRRRKMAEPERHYNRSAEELRDMKTRYAFHEMSKFQVQVEDGDKYAIDQWMDNAKTMIDDFLGTKPLNPSRDKSKRFPGFLRRSRDPAAIRLAELQAKEKSLQKHQDGVDSNDEDETPITDDFRDISFDQWVDVFCQYGMLLAKDQGSREQCYEVLNSAMGANVFYHTPHRIVRLHFCRLACAIVLSDEQMIIDEVRWFIKDDKSPYKFTSDVFRLYSLTSRLYHGPRTWYNSGPSQKFILRQIKALDFALLDPERKKLFATQNERDGWTNGGKNDGNPYNLPEHDPSLLALYGHILAIGGAEVAALNYYFRAYSVSPDDPITNFCIGTSFIHHAVKRHSENRQFQLQQGIAFMFRYHGLRSSSGIAIHIQEAEFNIARMWHALGVLHLALPAYEKCLHLAEQVRQEYEQYEHDENEEDYENFACEAAFAIRSILAVGGDVSGARRITEQWLVI